MTRLTKAKVLEMVREANCINTPTLNHYFKSVWVGEEYRRVLEQANRRLRK